MASVTRDFNGPVAGAPSWHKYFSESERERMAADDSQAWRAITTVLTAVVSLGLLAILGTVLWVL